MLERRLVEITPVRDVFASNIGSIEVLGSCARFVLYVERNQICEVVGRVIMPIENVSAAVALTVAQLGGYWAAGPVIPIIGRKAN